MLSHIIRAINGSTNSKGSGCRHAVIMSAVNRPKIIPARMQVLRCHILFDSAVGLVTIKIQDPIPKTAQQTKKIGKSESTCWAFIAVAAFSRGTFLLANVPSDLSLLAFGIPPAREAESAGGMPKVPQGQGLGRLAR